MSSYDPHLSKIRPWFWIVLAMWLFIMAFGVLAFLDYGFETFLPVETGSAAALEVAVKVVILALPVWTYPLAKRVPRK